MILHNMYILPEIPDSSQLTCIRSGQVALFYCKDLDSTYLQTISLPRDPFLVLVQRSVAYLYIAVNLLVLIYLLGIASIDFSKLIC